MAIAFYHHAAASAEWWSFVRYLMLPIGFALSPPVIRNVLAVQYRR